MSLLQGSPLDRQKLYLLKRERMDKKMTLNSSKGTKVSVKVSRVLGLLAGIFSGVSGATSTEINPSVMSRQENGLSARDNENAPSPEAPDSLLEKANSTPRYVSVDWDKVQPHINGLIRRKADEGAIDCLSRALEETKFFLKSFENDYGVSVVWRDAPSIWKEAPTSHPDMTEKLKSYVILVQAIRAMTGTDTEAFQKAMQQVTKKIADERAIGKSSEGISHIGEKER